MELHIGGDFWVAIQDLVDDGRAAPGQVGEGGGRRCLLLHHRRPQARVPGRPAGCCLVMVEFQREIWSYIIFSVKRVYFCFFFQIWAHRSLLCLASQQWRTLLQSCPNSEVFDAIYSINKPISIHAFLLGGASA